MSEQSSKSSLIYVRKKVHQVKEEPLQEFSEENGKDNDELRNFAAKFYHRTQDFWRQHSSGTPTMSCCGDQECKGAVILGGESQVGEHDDAPGTLWPRQREWLMAPHQWKWPLMETKNMAQAAKVADGAASVEVAADGNPANNQSPEADGWSNDNVSLAPTDPKGPPVWLNTTMSDQPDTIPVGQAP